MYKLFFLLVLAFLPTLALADCPAGSIVTPNLGLCEPPHGTPNWDQYYNTNWNILDTIVPGGGITGSPALGNQVVGNGSNFTAQKKAVYDTRDWMTCDGTIDATSGMAALLSAIGAAASGINVVDQCVLSTITIPSNVTLAFAPGAKIKVVTGQTVTILGPIIASVQQIFSNAFAGQGTVLIGGTAISKVYPEWWGAIPGNAGATGPNETLNTQAFQAAEIGAFGTNRTNGSGLSNLNRIMWFSDIYFINGEIQFYHVNGFRLEGANKLLNGISQAGTNKRIIDGQNISYGYISNLRFSTSATQTVPLIDLDNDGTHGSDLSPQFITFQDVQLFGNTLGQIGVLIAKTGSSAQGSNIVCQNCEGSGFTEAVWQVGGNNTGINAGRFYAQNAIDVGWYSGDMQGNPHYGIVTYGAGYVFVKDSTFEDGFAPQTGFDVYCEAPTAAEPCVLDNVRSESRRLAAGGNLKITNSYTINQASFPTPGNSMGLGTIISGSLVGWDGAYYKVTVNGTFGGVGTPTAPEVATSGGTTSIANSGASYTTNAFTGFMVSILSGTGTGENCIVTSNTGTAITCSAGWVTKFAQLAIVNPDSTSHYVVEPNWGTQLTSGGATFAALNENGIEGTTGGAAGALYLENVQVPGDTISWSRFTTMKNVVVTRPDWSRPIYNLDDNITNEDIDGVTIAQTVAVGGTTKFQKWSFPRNGIAAKVFSGYSQKAMGTLPMVWSCGQAGGGVSCYDTWIGGRSDPQGISVSRGILEFGGILGRPTAFGTDQNGTDTDFQGGLPTGAGTPGAINFWTGNTGSTGSTIADGTKRWQITALGHLFAYADNTYDIGASGANRPRNVYVAGNLNVGGTGTFTQSIVNGLGSWTKQMNGGTTGSVIETVPAIISPYTFSWPSSASTGLMRWDFSTGQWLFSTAELSGDCTTSGSNYITCSNLTNPNINAATGTSLMVTGIVDGTAPVTKTTGTTATLGAATYKSGYTFNQEATAATAVTYTLPATAVGLQYCVKNSIVSGTGAADTGVLTVYPPASSYVILNGTRNTIGGGGTHGVASGGAAGDAACFVAIDATDWEVYVQKGTWTAN